MQFPKPILGKRGEFSLFNAPVAQWTVRRTSNPSVVSSSLTRGATPIAPGNLLRIERAHVDIQTGDCTTDKRLIPVPVFFSATGKIP